MSGEFFGQATRMDQESNASAAALGRLLRTERERRGLSQEELAERAGAGTSTRTIGNIERGRTRPYRHTVEVLADALGLSASERDALLAAWRAESVIPAGHLPRNATGHPGDLLRGAPADRETVPATSSLTPPSNLPLALTSFIGREQELADVRRLLATTRLLTLTGSGGCGKTRLALEVGDLARASFADGVWLAELAPLADSALVPQAVATALGIREHPGLPLLRTLLAALGARQLLLLLDNCEHLIDACAGLADAILRACPNVQILATSREVLGIAGEVAWRVPSLGTPPPPPGVEMGPPGDADTGSLVVSASPRVPAAWVAEATRAPAVRLFVDRAKAVQPAFTLTPSNAPAVAEICRRLDGIPLALELAAARVPGLAVEQIAARLDQRFRLLTGGSRTAPPRQQTLRGAIGWSYALLSEPERLLFDRLSVFAGGLTLEAAEAVCAGDGLAREAVLDLLLRLVDKSLVLAEEREGAARYRQLETIREYGWACLATRGDLDVVRRRHADHFLVLAEQVDPPLRESQRATRLDLIEREHGNLRAALGWAIACEEGESGLRLGGALAWFWRTQGYLSEGRAWLRRLLALPQAAPRTALRARALTGAGLLDWRAGDYGAARTLHEEALTIWREVEDRRGIAQALAELSDTAIAQLDFPSARASAEASLAIWRELGDPPGTSFALFLLGVVAFREGGSAAAPARLHESLALARQSGDAGSAARALTGLGRIAHFQGDYAAARGWFEQSLAMSREVEDRWGAASALFSLGLVASGQGDYAAARTWLEESLTVARRGGDREGIARALYALGSLAYAQGAHPSAHALYEESLGFGREVGGEALIAAALRGLGRVAREQRDHRRARCRFEESLAIWRRVGDRRGVAGVLSLLGDLARREDNAAWAAALFQESLTLCQEVGNKRGAVVCLAALADLAEAAEQPTRAARLLGAAESRAESVGVLTDPADRDEYDRFVAAVRAGPREAAFAAAWAEGRAMTTEQAIAYALSEDADA